MTDASLLAAGAILLQTDTNQDLHPCAYFSRTFSPAQQNYDIYDRELLVVILALEEWHQYLQRTQHPITIITDHKNLSYIKDPQKLSRRQARWSLFLQDFDIVWQVTPGMKMAPTDALSRRDSVDTSSDNANAAICPEPAIIGALDLALAQHIQASSISNPLVLQAIENLRSDSPLFPRSSVKDWMYEGGHLYYKGRMYIPRLPHKPCPGSSLGLLLHQPPSAFFATIEVTTERTALRTNAHTVTRWPLDTLHICVCEPDAPFVSIGDIPTESAHSEFVEIVINQGTLQMIVHFRISPQNRRSTYMEMGHLCNFLRRESIILKPEAQVYERGNVTIDHLEGTSFLLCCSYRRMFPLGLCQYLEDRYVFSLGPQFFSLAPFPQGAPTPVPLLLFPS